MALLGFKKFLVPMITKGEPWWKLGTIRALRKNPFETREVLHMYTGLRTKNCEYLGVTLCSHVYSFTMHLSISDPTISNWQIPPVGFNTTKFTWKQEKHPILNSKRTFWDIRGIEELAITDGFTSAQEMWSWFRDAHGKEDQIFQRIEWKWPPQKLRDLTKKEIKIILEEYYPVKRPLPLKYFSPESILTDLPDFTDFEELSGKEEGYYD